MRSDSSLVLHPSSFGFTLVELLVTLTIIVVLAALLIPAVMKSIGKAHGIRLQGDLQTISQALESYRADFGDYPRPAYGAGITGDATHPNPPTGAEILCRALIGPAPAMDSNANPPIPAQDGADGPGFRVRGTSGRVYGPYIAADKFKVYSLDITQPGPYARSSAGGFAPLLAFIADIDGNPILYFPAAPVRPTNLALKGFYVAPSSQTNNVQQSLFDSDANFAYMQFIFHDASSSWRAPDTASETDSNTSTAFERICIMLGDYNSGNPSAVTNCDGAIDAAGERAVTQPFVLWCAGPDGKFGSDSTTPSTADLSKLDDATNIQ